MVGEVARSLYADAQEMLKQIVDERWFEARGVVGLWPANSDGDDIVVWTDETRTVERARLHTLRQQMAKGEGRANAALADFIAPAGADYIGGFAVTAGHGEAAIAARFKAAGDDYSAILAAALADRLAEAFAEALHHKVRAELWGYAPDEAFDLEPLLPKNTAASARRRAIRPSRTTPKRRTLFALLDGTAATGIALTESFAMTPPASVSGLYSPTRGPLFRRRQDRARPGRGLRPPQGLGCAHGGAVAGADLEL